VHLHIYDIFAIYSRTRNIAQLSASGYRRSCTRIRERN